MVIQSYSWTVFSDAVAIKKTDLSVFKNNGTVIPIEIRNFFSIEDLQYSKTKQIILRFRHLDYKAKLERSRSLNKTNNTVIERTRLFWHSDLSERFNHYYPNVTETENYPDLRFFKLDDKTYVVEFIDDTLVEEGGVSISNDLETVITLGGAKEGQKKLIYTTKYERSSANRERAIKKWGTTCMACNFNFEETYGELGRDFIEVHHIKPLHTLDEEMEVTPETDLICLCSNCHRMVHRSMNSVLTLEELKALINKNKKAESSD